MGILNLPSWKDLPAFATNRPLGDPVLPRSPVSLGLSPQSSAIDISDPVDQRKTVGRVTVGVDVTTSVAVISRNTDPDPIGFFNLASQSQSATAPDQGGPIPRAPVKFDPASAYVVVSGLSVSGRVDPGFSIGTNGVLGLHGDASLVTDACAVFPQATLCWTALDFATRNFGTIFAIDELLALKGPGTDPWQILSFGAQGTLKCCFTLTAGSLASTLAGAINAAIGDLGPISFCPAPSASVTVSAAIDGGYRVFAQRVNPQGSADAPAIAFSIKKSRSTSRGLDGGLGLHVGIKDDDVNALISSVFDQISGVAAGTAQAILARGAALDAAQNNALQTILAKLGRNDPAQGAVDSLRSAIASVQAEVVNRLTPTVAAQFTYSWQRLTEASLAVRFVVPDAVLPQLHGRILAMDLADILAHGPANGVQVTDFLGTESTETDIGYGFSFGVAGYTFLKSWDSLRVRFVEQDTEAGDGGLLRQFSFLGKRAYESTWFGRSQKNYVELDAATPAPLPAPSFPDFRLGLSIGFAWTNVGFGAMLNEAADLGVLFDLFDTDDSGQARSRLVAAGLPTDKTGDGLVALTVPDAALRLLLPILAGPDYLGKVAPRAMARALPCCDLCPERVNVTQRTSIYAGVFATFLATEDVSGDVIARLCREELYGKLSPGALASESAGQVPWTAQRTVEDASAENLRDAVSTGALAAFKTLLSQAGDFRDLLPGCVANLSVLGAQSYGCRILASMLVIAACQQPGILDRMSRTLHFTWQDGADQRVLALARGKS